MTGLTQVREAVAERLRTVEGLNVYASLPASVNVPAAVVLPATDAFITYDTAMGAVDDLALRVLLVVGRGEDTIAQTHLDTFTARAGPTSIKAALEPDLAGVVDYARVTQVANWGVHQVGEVGYFGCEFNLTVGMA